MAFDFSVNATDKIQTAHTVANSTSINWHTRVYRTGAGGGSLGEIWQKNNIATALLNSGASYQFAAAFSTTNGIWTFTRPSDNAWHTITIVYDGINTANNPVIYVDGATVTVTRVTAPVGTFSTIAALWNVGNSNANSRNFGGYISDFAMWSGRLLTAGECAQLGKGSDPRCIPLSLKICISLIRIAHDWCYGVTAPTVTGTSVVSHPPTRFPHRPFTASKATTVSPFIDAVTYGDRISLAWTANVDGDLAGYKLYQGTATGVYGAPSDVGNNTSVTAVNLTLGTKYYFAVSAYDSSGNEGAKSAEIVAYPTSGMVFFSDQSATSIAPARKTRLIQSGRCRSPIGH